MTRDNLQRVFDRISTRLNDYLCEMSPGYDDSVVGFNEAWDQMRIVFKDEIDTASRITPENTQVRIPEELDEVIGKLTVAALQLAPSDDQIIAGHVRDSVALLLKARHKMREATHTPGVET